jgi:SAM-dependent methyltransferase
MAMSNEVTRRLLDLNRAFYDHFAEEFAATRAKPQPGFHRLLDYLLEPCASLLDVGCGGGRFGAFVLEHRDLERYVGVDFSRRMMAMSPQDPRFVYHERVIGQEGFLDGLGRFEAVACLAALQHIPGSDRRTKALAEMGRHLAPGGRLLISTWQFLDSERQRKKIAPWSAAGLTVNDVEQHDYLLTWKRGGRGLRYVAYIGPDEVNRMTAVGGLEVIAQFHSDGLEGNLNLYTVCKRREAPR